MRPQTLLQESKIIGQCSGVWLSIGLLLRALPVCSLAIELLGIFSILIGLQKLIKELKRCVQKRHALEDNIE